MAVGRLAVAVAHQLLDVPQSEPSCRHVGGVLVAQVLRSVGDGFSRGSCPRHPARARSHLPSPCACPESWEAPQEIGVEEAAGEAAGEAAQTGSGGGGGEIRTLEHPFGRYPISNSVGRFRAVAELEPLWWPEEAIWSGTTGTSDSSDPRKVHGLPRFRRLVVNGW